MTTATIEILRRHDVEAMVGLRRSAIYAAMASGQFPKPVKLSRRAVGWKKSDVQQWLSTREAA